MKILINDSTAKYTYCKNFRLYGSVIIYNLDLQEKSDHEVDRRLFAELRKTVSAPKLLRILMGRKKENKQRPLIVVFKHEENKLFLLSSSAKLRQSDMYESVCIRTYLSLDDKI